MKTRFSLIYLAIVSLLGISLCISCDKKDETKGVVTYKGIVVYDKTTTPFPDLEVKLTDGNNVSATTKTNAEGAFSFKVDLSTINGDYYFLVGDATCIQKKVEIPGWGQAEIDLGTIGIEGPTLPEVKTIAVTNITADAANAGGEVLSDGRLEVTARGVCYSTKEYPTIDDLHTSDGTGIGEFTSSLKNLEFKTIYYVRAYATNKKGTAYGEQVMFTTEAGVAIVTTDTIINITAHTAKCKATVVSDGGFAVVKRGICWSKHPDPTVDDEITDDGSGLGEFTATLKDLLENTTYYVRAYATNSTATVYGRQIIINTLDGLPVVTTNKTDNITATGFVCFGTVVSDCDIPVTTRGFCYSKNQYPTTDDDYTTSGKGLGEFQSTISKLEYGTTYYVRAYATNETATTYGEQLSITTLSGLATVTTKNVTNIGSVKATCGGNVTNDGTLTVTARGVCYGTEQQPTIEGDHTTDGKGKGEFTSSLKDLKDKTTYYVRAYATTDAGTAYGEQKSFKTEDGIPIVELKTVSNITATGALCKGNVTGDGGLDVTERGFCYSTSQYPQISDKHLAVGSGMGEYSASLTELEVGTTYYVRAYATNGVGIGYSQQQNFTTTSGLATLTTTNATSTAFTITAGGNITENGGFAVNERGICYSSTNSEPSITDGKLSGGSGNGTFTVTIPELTPNTLYHIRAYATNSIGTTYGNVISIMTKDGVANVSTGDIVNITALTATGGVSVTDAGGATLKSCGICWSTAQNPTISNSHVEGGKQLGTYSCNMTELTPNTTYYVRAYATTDVKTSYGSQVSFKTTSGLATLTTSISSTTASSIVAEGNITNNGGYAVSERGICYSTTNAEPTTNDLYIANGSGNGTFNVSITNLKANTTYYIRAYATNKIGTSYGDAKTAITKDGSATLTTSQITNITALTAAGGVSVTDAGGATLKSCGICWSTTQNPTISNSHVEGGTQLGTYSCNMTELTPNTTYYVRAYATTDVKTVYGNQVSFKTTIGLPTLTTASTTATSTTISTGGSISSDGGYAVTSRGVCYSTTNAAPTIADKVVTNGTGNGGYQCTITGVSVSTAYYVRAYATNQIGTSYGNTEVVTTGAGLPTVMTTSPGIHVTKTTIQTGGHVLDDGGYTVTSRGVVYATTPYPTIANGKVSSGSSVGTYTSTITNVDISSQTYYIRAYATNTNGTVYGDQIVVTPQLYEYTLLPTFMYNGQKYRIYNDMGIATQQGAISQCSNFTFAGFDDWFLPSVTELVAAAQANIGGWETLQNDTTIYWSSTINVDFPYYYYYYVALKVSSQGNGTLIGYFSRSTDYFDRNGFRYRAVRKED